ncbi:MAG: UDP-N-acetylmuramoyl-tripeptide--D-alanyl-D-alanine ligase [Alphaproteobacteria bacterium]|nr:UDP-N-acetylmuramoyl-tripeptide--D-alanyl-D-alanine ligase [Alphaproteobacteria bacterium]
MAQDEIVWTRQDLTAALNPSKISDGDFICSGVSIDSRTLQQGDLFIALTGEKSDGHDFLASAEANGAAAAIVSDAHAADRLTIPYILVSNTETALQSLALYRRQQTKATVIAITGSVGKTSTKEALKFLLENFGKTYATQGNFNNHYGVPLSLSRMTRDCDYAIFEIGTSNPGEISPLARLVQPRIAIITAVAAAHLQNFRDLSEIAEEKKSIIDGLDRKGILFYNGVTCPSNYGDGAITSVDYMRQSNLNVNSRNNQSCLTINFDNRVQDFSRIPNNFIIEQIFYACLEVAKHLHLSLDKTCEILNSYRLPKGRGKHTILSLAPRDCDQKRREILLIDDSYNANPLSMKESLIFAGNFAAAHNKSLFLVLGNMLELGNDRLRFHQELAEYIDQRSCTTLFTLGEQISILSKAKFYKTKVTSFTSIAELEKKIFDNLDENSVLLIKGSHGTGLYRIVDVLLSFEVNS